jgi:flagella basal body P-ring formation protein FlgA
MIRRWHWLLIWWVLFQAGSALGAPSWRLVLPETATVTGSRVRLADIAVEAIPAAAGDLVLLGQGKPGSCVNISRRTILRRLVEAGLAGGVALQGATDVTVNFQGQQITAESLRGQIRAAVQPLVPAGTEGAPASWFEMDIPGTPLAVAGDPQVEILQTSPLAPGRNQLRVRVQHQQGQEDLSVKVTLHQYGEIPAARLKIDRDTPLEPHLFQWSWLDLAEVSGQLVTSRAALQGACAGRTLPAGEMLRNQDLKAIPVVNSGDRVVLLIERGRLQVSVQAQARQDGCLGQTIPVRNELNGRLVNARVCGPGLVEWRQ